MLGCHTVYELSMQHSELNFNKYLPKNDFFLFGIFIRLFFLFGRHTKRMLIFVDIFSSSIEVSDQCAAKVFHREKIRGCFVVICMPHAFN